MKFIMKKEYLFIAIILLFGQITFCQTAVSGKIDNYTGKDADIIINPLFPETLGKINTEGEFTANFDGSSYKRMEKIIEESQKKETGRMNFSTLKKFQTRYKCEDDSFSFTNSEQPYTQLLGAIGFIVGNLKSNEVNGIIKVVNSKDFGGSQVFNPQNDPIVGYLLDWYYVEKVAKVDGNCSKTMSTGEGDETYDWNIKIELDFQPGWNLVQYEISKVFTGKAGDKFIQNASYSSLDKVPEDVKYIYSKK